MSQPMRYGKVKSSLVTRGLKHPPADSHALSLKRYNFHQIATGPQLRDLHLMFEEHFTESSIAVD